MRYVGCCADCGYSETKTGIDERTHFYCSKNGKFVKDEHILCSNNLCFIPRRRKHGH